MTLHEAIKKYFPNGAKPGFVLMFHQSLTTSGGHPVIKQVLNDAARLDIYTNIGYIQYTPPAEPIEARRIEYAPEPVEAKRMGRPPASSKE